METPLFVTHRIIIRNQLLLRHEYNNYNQRRTYTHNSIQRGRNNGNNQIRTISQENFSTVLLSSAANNETLHKFTNVK